MPTEQAGTQGAVAESTKDEVARGTNYKGRRIDGLMGFAEKLLQIRTLLDTYQGKAQDPDTVQVTMNLMQLAVTSKDFWLWLVEKDDMGVGILSARVSRTNRPDADPTTDVMVDIGHVDNSLLAKSEADAIISEAMSELEKWAKGLGARSIFIQSARNDKSFSKFISRFGWRRITTLYEKEISNVDETKGDQPATS